MAALDAPLASAEPVPIAAIYELTAAGGDSVRRTSLKGKDAFSFLDGQAHRKWMGFSLGLGPQLFRQTCAIASAAPVYRLKRPRDLSRLDEVAVLIEGSRTRSVGADPQESSSAAAFSALG